MSKAAWEVALLIIMDKSEKKNSKSTSKNPSIKQVLQKKIT